MIFANFNRRKFIQSIALGWMASNPVSSFGKKIKKSDSSNVSDLLFYINAKGQKKPVTTLAEWQIKRQQILTGLQHAMGLMPDQSQLPDLNIHIIEQVNEDRYTRFTIQFTVAENENIPAYLYVPIQKSNKKKLPAMLALHPTGAQGKEIVDGQSALPNRAYAKELAQRGYVVIAPDYPGYGDLKNYDFKTDRYQSGTMKSVFDAMRCIDLLQARADVDPTRIGVIGHSLGGHSAMFVGAFDIRLKVIVSSCGWTLMEYYNAGQEVTKKYGNRLAPWAQEVYMPRLRDAYDLDARKIPFDFDEVIAALAPRSFFSNSPENDSNFDVNGVRKGIDNASEVYRFVKADNNLVVRYPDSEHDFPAEVRFEAYNFIDKVFGVNSNDK
ncbi:MAG: alpha/beta fold hydrolase [Segetibacter sp.]